MQISADQLLNHLKRGLAPIYFVYGEEQLLVEECTRAVRDAAHAAGYLERQVLTVESGFDWNGLFNSTQSLSSSQRRLIELRLPENRAKQGPRYSWRSRRGRPPIPCLS
jgi:DNA polymerase-3 subunit delta